MAIATLIAAGRLDDRLVDRALGLLRELDPGADFRQLDRRGRCRRPALRRRSQGRALGARGARRTSMSSSSRTSRAAKRLLVADMDSTIIGQECIDELADYAGPQGRGRRGSPSGRCRASSISPARCASGSRCSRARQRAHRRCLDERVRPDRGRGDAGPDDARRRLELPARLGRLPVLRRAGRGDGRLRPGPRQPPGVRRRQAERRGRRPDRRCRWPSATR